jgi:hypothetical protein
MSDRASLLSAEKFYEDSLCWLGRPKEVYRLLVETAFPSISTWVRGDVDTHGLNHWLPEEVRPFLYPVVSIGEEETLVLPCEALLLCGPGNYYNPCDLAIAVVVQRPQEIFSQLMLRIRQTESIISRGPDVRMLWEQVNLTRRGKDYINTKYLVWPYALSKLAQDTLLKQGVYLIRLSPAESLLVQ